jgi:hypothetical protein
LRVVIILEIRIWGDWNGNCASGPVHGATTHENSTTMRLYGYGLAQYVVETSLGVPTCGADCVGAQSVWLEMCGFGCSQHP